MLGRSQNAVAIRYADLRMRRPQLHNKSYRGGKDRAYDDATARVAFHLKFPFAGGLLFEPATRGSRGRRHWLRRTPITNSLYASPLWIGGYLSAFTSSTVFSGSGR